MATNNDNQSSQQQPELESQTQEKIEYTDKPNKKISFNPLDYLSKAKTVITNFIVGLFGKLTLSQKLYLFAFLNFALSWNDEGSIFDGISFTGVLALAGLFIEVWPKFVKVWESLLGRIFIVLFYAIIANLAVAIAAQKVNAVVGIDPSPLFYTLGFTTVLLAPMWLLGFTVVFMVLYMVFLQLWLITVFLLKLIRVPIYRDPTKFKVAFPITTNIIRIILLPIMMTSLTTVAELYVGDIHFGTPGVVEQVLQQDERSKEQLIADIDRKVKELEGSGKDVSEVLKQELQQAQNEAPENVQLSKDLLALIQKEAGQSYAEKYDNTESAERQNKRISELIAWFVHKVETFEFSQCEKTEDERAVYIGESDILVSKKNNDAEFGYDFSVRTCQLANTK